MTLVSVHNVRGDGSRIDASGPNPKGIVIYTSDGHFAFINTRSDLPRFASNSRDQGTPEEYKAVVLGSIAYFGTYSSTRKIRSSPTSDCAKNYAQAAMFPRAQGRVCGLCGRAFAIVLPPDVPERERDRLCITCAALPLPTPDERPTLVN